MDLDIVPTAYVPAPGTDLIVNLRWGRPFTFDSALSFSKNAQSEYRVIAREALSGDPKKAYEIAFDNRFGITNVNVDSLRSFWSAYDLNGNRITDEQSFRNYLLSLDDLYKNKASEDPEFVWEQGYVGVFDPDNIILKNLRLGFVRADY